MTFAQAQSYLASLTDAQLVEKLAESMTDLKLAKQDDPTSDWFLACESGVVAYQSEIYRREALRERGGV